MDLNIDTRQDRQAIDMLLDDVENETEKYDKTIELGFST
jgi:hypothetical protein